MYNSTKSSVKIEEQNIQLGSSHILKSNQVKPFDRIDFMIKNMKDNFAFKSYLINNNVQKDYKKILSDFQKRYKEYRSKWHDEANKQYASKIDFLNDTSTLSNPLCIDIEVAAICDLGCPHCFREHIITPDKIMSENLFKI